jgi:hypothetical protein
MTKHLGYDAGDFHYEEAHRRTGFATKVLPRILRFCVPLAIVVIALYLGRYAFGG